MRFTFHTWRLWILRSCMNPWAWIQTRDQKATFLFLLIFMMFHDFWQTLIHAQVVFLFICRQPIRFIKGCLSLSFSEDSEEQTWAFCGGEEKWIQMAKEPNSHQNLRQLLDGNDWQWLHI